MARPVVREETPTVVPIEVARSPNDVRRELSELGVREAGNIRSLETAKAMALVEGFYGRQAFVMMPFAVEVPQGTLTAAAEREAARGGYIQDTNIIMMSDRATRPVYRSPETGQRTMVHELLHYLSFLGSGHRMSYVEEGGGRRELETPTWLSEGITQSFAELILPSRDSPTYSYTYEVLTAVLLERLAGAETLKAAFRSGDFSAVQEAVDRNLGAGIFARLLEQNDGASAYMFLYGAAFGMRAGESPLREENFLSDIRVRGAMKAIDLLQDPEFRRLAEEAKRLRGSDAPREALDGVAGRIMEMERLS
jgi:hypothetical protein